MTDPSEVAQLIKKGIAGAEVKVEDMTGTGDHFQILVVSSAFKGKMLIDQHRLVQQALKEAMDDGRIHAVHIKTQTPEESARKGAQDSGDFKIVH
jgi:acid stress-induced BolA-like protein IbaG/YrbA